MRNVLAASSSGTGGAAVWLWTVLLACCLESAWIAVYAEDLPAIVGSQSEIEIDNPQMSEMSKRDWNKELKIWGKRGWSNLHGGWGRKRSVPSWDDQMVYNSPSIVDKRAWQRLQSGWGKRLSPDEEYGINPLALMFERDPQIEQPYTEYGPDADMEITEEEKRNWKKFNDGWGKRTKWEKMNGMWGKRDPAWSNLKGMWGKRSIPNEISK